MPRRTPTAATWSRRSSRRPNRAMVPRRKALSAFGAAAAAPLWLARADGKARGTRRYARRRPPQGGPGSAMTDSKSARQNLAASDSLACVSANATASDVPMKLLRADDEANAGEYLVAPCLAYRGVRAGCPSRPRTRTRDAGGRRLPERRAARSRQATLHSVILSYLACAGLHCADWPGRELIGVPMHKSPC